MLAVPLLQTEINENHNFQINKNCKIIYNTLFSKETNLTEHQISINYKQSCVYFCFQREIVELVFHTSSTSY